MNLWPCGRFISVSLAVVALGACGGVTRPIDSTTAPTARPSAATAGTTTLVPVPGRPLGEKTGVPAVDDLLAATPDKTVSDWYVPYFNQEKVAPRFHGEINGIQLGVQSGPTPACARPEIEPDWLKAITGTPFALNLVALPEGVALWGLPEVGRCADDGRVMWIIARFSVAPGPGINGTSGLVQVSRWEGVRWYSQEFLAEKVAAGSIASRPAAFADVGLSGFGQAGVFVQDREIDGSTMLLSTNVSLGYLKIIAEALYR